MYDVIVVGGRCAGAAISFLLARRGFRVLMLDRATFPSDTISGHCVLHRGTVRLRRWGLLNEVIASNCPPITRVSTNFSDFTLSGDVPVIDGAPAAIGPRRTVLDTILIEAAVAAGAEFRQGVSLDALLTDHDRVVGIRGRTKHGMASEERARLVIGADGKHSTVARLVQAPTYLEVPSLTCWYISYWTDFPCEGLEIHWRPDRAVFTLPTNDGLVMHAVAWPKREFPVVRTDIEQHVLATLNLMPDLAERLPGARRAEPFVGMSRVPGFFRRPYGPGWALVGDAGHHKDPVPAYGISDAFCDAELLAEAVEDGFGGRLPLGDALSRYEQRRNERAIPDYRDTCQRATLAGWDAPPMLALRAGLRGDAAKIGLYYAVMAKALAPEALASLAA